MGTARPWSFPPRVQAPFRCANPFPCRLDISKGPRGGPLEPPRASAAGQSPSALTRLVLCPNSTFGRVTTATVSCLGRQRRRNHFLDSFFLRLNLLSVQWRFSQITSQQRQLRHQLPNPFPRPSRPARQKSRPRPRLATSRLRKRSRPAPSSFISAKAAKRATISSTGCAPKKNCVGSSLAPFHAREGGGLCLGCKFCRGASGAFSGAGSGERKKSAQAEQGGLGRVHIHAGCGDEKQAPADESRITSFEHAGGYRGTNASGGQNQRAGVSALSRTRKARELEVEAVVRHGLNQVKAQRGRCAQRCGNEHANRGGEC